MTDKITKRIAQEIVSHEAIVREAYKDSVGVWTWSVGITNSSGHQVYPRYKDKPQSLEHCLEIYAWLLNKKYLPSVLKAFEGHDLEEHELGGALSFHWNTGRIRTASWVKKWKAGDIVGARAGFMEWKKPPEIIGRRKKECKLFFDGKWSATGKATVLGVRKPSYSPNWGSAKRVDISAALDQLFEDRPEPPPEPKPDILMSAVLTAPRSVLVDIRDQLSEQLK